MGSLPILTDLRGRVVRGPRMLRTASSVVRASKPLSRTAIKKCKCWLRRVGGLTVGGMTAHFICGVVGGVELSLGSGTLEARLSPSEVLDSALRNWNISESV